MDIGDLYRLGGTNTLRGYREDQFLGDRIFWSNLEYRLLLARRSFAFVFLDTGYYLRNAEPSLNVLKSEGFKIGYGIGFDVDTSLEESKDYYLNRLEIFHPASAGFNMTKTGICVTTVK